MGYYIVTFSGMRLLLTTQAVDLDDPILGFFHGWIEEFAKHSKHIDVICLREGRHNLPGNVSVHSLGKENGENRFKYTFRFYTYFWKLYVRNKVDFVFFHMGAIYNTMAAPFFLIRKFKKTKFYWWKAHGHINSVGRLALNFVDRVYTSTESGFPIKTKKRHIIGQAVDSSFFTFSDKEKKYDLIFVGRVTPVKHIEDFVGTVAILKKNYPNIQCAIVGPFFKHEYKEEIERLVESLELSGNIQFLGSKTQKELIEIYQTAKVFLNPSTTHSMDKTVLEAILCGCIPVTCNNAFKELCGESGLYIQNPTNDQYVERIEQLLGSDTQALIQKLKFQVEQKHSLHTFSNRIFE